MMRVVCTAVVVYCHSRLSIAARFLFRAQDKNMTNGDFVFFTFWSMNTALTARPWIFYVRDGEDLARRQQAFYVVKEVRVYY